ncbi:hypothetical protein MNBD_GAMMA08-1313 [hydrothermal vent metagenome]|uniref:Uncharacterized protein n=1 Tax=hydrothermal vent metagenome TaxID=652676 RepID=A0A3B0WVZ7_9ZZZZ
MKLPTLAIIVVALAAANASANVFDNDQYEDNLRPAEIGTNVDMLIHGDHFEGMINASDMKTNVPITAEDAQAFDDDEYEFDI